MNNKQKQLRESIRRAIKQSLSEQEVFTWDDPAAAAELEAERGLQDSESTFEYDYTNPDEQATYYGADDIGPEERQARLDAGNVAEDYFDPIDQGLLRPSSAGWDQSARSPNQRFGYRDYKYHHHRGEDTGRPTGRLSSDYDWTGTWNRYRDEVLAPARTSAAIAQYEAEHGEQDISEQEYIDQGLIPNYYEQEYDRDWIRENPYAELSEEELGGSIERMMVDSARQIRAPANMQIISVCSDADAKAGRSTDQCISPVGTSGNRVVARFWDNESEQWLHTGFNHLESLPDVQVGQFIGAGETIGSNSPAVIGTTGASSAPHLHHAVWKQPAGWAMGGESSEYVLPVQTDQYLRKNHGKGSHILDSEGQPQVDPDLVQYGDRGWIHKDLVDWSDFILNQRGGLGEQTYEDPFGDNREWKRGPNDTWYYRNSETGRFLLLPNQPRNAEWYEALNDQHPPVAAAGDPQAAPQTRGGGIVRESTRRRFKILAGIKHE